MCTLVCDERARGECSRRASCPRSSEYIFLKLFPRITFIGCKLEKVACTHTAAPVTQDGDHGVRCITSIASCAQHCDEDLKPVATHHRFCVDLGEKLFVTKRPPEKYGLSSEKKGFFHLQQQAHTRTHAHTHLPFSLVLLAPQSKSQRHSPVLE